MSQALSEVQHQCRQETKERLLQRAAEAVWVHQDGHPERRSTDLSLKVDGSGRTRGSDLRSCRLILRFITVYSGFWFMRIEGPTSRLPFHAKESKTKRSSRFARSRPFLMCGYTIDFIPPFSRPIMRLISVSICKEKNLRHEIPGFRNLRLLGSASHLLHSRIEKRHLYCTSSCAFLQVFGLYSKTTPPDVQSGWGSELVLG